MLKGSKKSTVGVEVWTPGNDETPGSLEPSRGFENLRPIVFGKFGDGQGEALWTPPRHGVHVRFERMKRFLQPMYKAFPKNENGYLNHPAVRYLLHRLFSQQYGWFVNDLVAGMGGKKWNDCTMSEFLTRNTPADIGNAFEKELSTTGIDLNSTALLAVTIEAVILETAKSSLSSTYNILGVNKAASVTKEKATEILYYNMFIRLMESTRVSTREAFTELNREEQVSLIHNNYPKWKANLKFIRVLLDRFQPFRKSLNLTHVTGAMQELERRWALWSAADDCTELKNGLLEIEDGKDSGCVHLSDFYQHSFTPTGYMFQETPGFLRRQGVLEESQENNSHVVIANYLVSHTNCLPITSQYSACCPSDCGRLQLVIETSLQSSFGKPTSILDALEGTRSISDKLVQRLNDIAKHHGGEIPIQGRLFAQWLHFAFPTECPYPHLADRVGPAEHVGNAEDQMASRQFRLQFIEESKPYRVRLEHNGSCATWINDEELFVATMSPVTVTLAELEQDHATWVSAYLVSLLCITALLVSVLIRAFFKCARQTRGLAQV
eukprot:TRINITY_DN14347_c0_g2_i1.p1 TRINITY_DN14347_c0_g2~~TRINITY_DN14347_c0_g2_i1.p1  ORF type:complete len:552 (+),score=45.41 TRINITY_DN14347_c0_g2_i1:46-1701(+)